MNLTLFTQALLAGLMVTAVTAPLGCFVVWRRLSYFGDAIAHSSLLGVMLGLLWQVNLNMAILPVTVLFALILSLLQGQTRFSSDTLLGILAHLALALGIVILSVNPLVQIDLMAYLFGDILAVSSDDLIVMYGFAAVVLLLLAACWRPLLLATLSEELARVNGVRIHWIRTLLMVMVAVTIALAIKLVGLLLITAMLVIPAASALFYARTPPQMAWIATGISAASVWFGLSTAWRWDLPAGPAIVLVAGLFFLLSLIARLVRR